MYVRKKVTKRAAAVISATVLATITCASTSFGGTWIKPFVSAVYQPIIECTSPDVTPGGTADFYVDTNSTGMHRNSAHSGKTKDGQVNVHIYSSPLGAVAYDGPLNGTAGFVSAPVSPNAPTGPVQVYLQTDDGGSATASVTVSN